jgi:hypothetical protein
MTLVELMMAMTLAIVLFTIVAISLDAFLRVGNGVQASYTNSNEILPMATTVQRLIRTEVEPAPPSAAGVPVPMFKVGAETPYAATFYSNVGSTNGPAQVVASLVSGTFSVTEQLPTAGSCPTSTTSTAQCQYPATGTVATLVSIPYVTNAAGAGTPIFTYTLLDPGFSTPQSTVSGTSITTTFASCAATVSGTRVSTTCPGDTVQGVEVNLLVQSPHSTQTEQDTVIYRLSATSQVFDPNVG